MWKEKKREKNVKVSFGVECAYRAKKKLEPKKNSPREQASKQEHNGGFPSRPRQSNVEGVLKCRK